MKNRNLALLIYLLRRCALGALSLFSVVLDSRDIRADLKPIRQCTPSRFPRRDRPLTYTGLRCGPDGLASSPLLPEPTTRRDIFASLLTSRYTFYPGFRQWKKYPSYQEIINCYCTLKHPTNHKYGAEKLTKDFQKTLNRSTPGGSRKKDMQQ